MITTNNKQNEKIQNLDQMNYLKQKLEEQHWWGNLQKLIFPPMCGICGKLNENYLCGKCNLDLQRVSCFQVESYLTESGFKRKYFEEHIYFFQYQGLIRNQIINYKFNEEAYKYKAISSFILKNFILKDSKAFQTINDYDVILPVPISRKRLKERGYNQSELIAKQIALCLNKKLSTKSLYKCKHIIAQSKLNKEEREANIKNVYAIKSQNEICGKKVLLLDDIYTTGSTANECCRILEEGGATKIGVMTIAKD